MHDLKLLLRLQAGNLLRLNELRHTKDKKQRLRLAGLLVTYLLLAVMGLLYAGFFAWSLYQGGLARLLPGYMTLLVSAMTLMLALTRAQGSLFAPRGSEMLFSLPLRGSSILISRLLGLYLSALGFCLCLLLPAWVFYLMAGYYSLPTLLRLLLLTLFMPMLPLALGIVLGGLIALLVSRLRQKNLIGMGLTLLVLAYFMVWIYTSPYENLDQQGYLQDLVMRLGARLEGLWPPSGLAARAAEGSIGSLLLFMALGALSLGLLAALMAPRYRGMLQFFSRLGSASRRTGRKPLSPLLALTRKEARRLLSSPIYLMNTAMMAWLGPVMLLIVLIAKPGLVQGLVGTPGVGEILMPLLPIAAGSFVSLSATTTVAFSIEGRSAWLMCTAPVSRRTLLLGKALLSLLNAWPACGAMALMISLALRPPLLTALACLLLPMAMALFAAFMGLWIDLSRARYDWENEQALVKSSAQTLLAMLVSFLVLLLLGLALFFSGPLAGWTALALALVLAGLSLLLLRRLEQKPVYLA
ncbi:MAG: hypothetical protein AB9880_08300 [Christensenellales bacterium]